MNRSGQIRRGLVSVVVPCYNAERFVTRCLDSILKQSYEDIEVICVNDCSPDRTLDVLYKYRQDKPNVKVVDLKKNVGVGSARDEGLLKASGEYVMFVDPDDWLCLDTINRYVHLMDLHQADMVEFGYRRVSSFAGYAINRIAGGN